MRADDFDDIISGCVAGAHCAGWRSAGPQPGVPAAVVRPVLGSVVAGLERATGAHGSERQLLRAAVTPYFAAARMARCTAIVLHDGDWRIQVATGVDPEPLLRPDGDLPEALRVLAADLVVAGELVATCAAPFVDWPPVSARWLGARQSLSAAAAIVDAGRGPGLLLVERCRPDRWTAVDSALLGGLAGLLSLVLGRRALLPAT